MDWLSATILGIVEGITEFLPVSSTGHLILTSKLLGVPETEFTKTFEIAIQLGAILSVIVLYSRSLIRDVELIKKVIAAFIPTGVIGLLAHHAVKTYLMGSTTVVLVSLSVGGLFLILFEVLHKDAAGAEAREVTYGQAAMIGVFQSLAMFPGVSRSAATIVGGLALGKDRKTIVEFSFLLAIPTMLAATVLDIYKNEHPFTRDEFKLLAIGFVVSFAVALLGIKFLLRLIQKHTFISFGIYRIAAAAAFYLIMFR